MAKEAYAFLSKLEKLINFTTSDKLLLKSYADWGKEIAPEMADHFYAYMGSDEEMSQILNDTEGRIHRLRETFAHWFHEMFTGMDDW